MARNSLAAAKAELTGLFTSGGNVGGASGVYAYEPLSGQMAKPTAVTVSTAGMDPDFYQLAVRIYHTADVDVKVAQDTLDGLILAVEGRLTSGFGEAAWVVDYSPDLNAFVATCVIPIGREDHG